MSPAATEDPFAGLGGRCARLQACDDFIERGRPDQIDRIERKAEPVKVPVRIGQTWQDGCAGDVDHARVWKSAENLGIRTHRDDSSVGDRNSVIRVRCLG